MENQVENTSPDPGIDPSTGRATVGHDFLLGSRQVRAGELLVMAVLNRTPDSFVDRGAHFGDAAAMDRVAQCVEEGADLLDIGGVKAGVGEDVDVTEELRRVVPFVAAVRAAHPDLPISVDTWRHQVAREAGAAGADVVNDAWQGADPRVAEVAAELGMGLVCSHAGGHAPRQDPDGVEYDDVAADVIAVTSELARTAVARGVDPRRLILDAAFDFGKTSAHSLAAAAATRRLVATGYPVMCALSYKDFIGESVGWEGPVAGRLPATLAATAVLAWEGAQIFRAHDVRATRHALDMVTALRTGVPQTPRRGLRSP